MGKSAIRSLMVVSMFMSFVFTAGPAHSQEPTEREKQLETLVKQLMKRVDELEARLDQSEAKQETLKEAVESTSQAVQSQAEEKKEDPNAIYGSWNKGLTFGTKNGAFKFRLGAWMHNDWFAGSIDNGDFPDGTRFHQMWLYSSGILFDDFEYRVIYDIAGGDFPRFRDVFLGYTGLDFLKLRVGQFKEPFSMDELISNNDITFMERTPWNAIVPSRETGLMFYNEILDHRMTWAVGAFKNVNAFGDGYEDDLEGGDWDVMARITGLPWYEDGGRKLIHLGLAGGHREWSDEPLRIRARGSFSVGDRLIDTGQFDADSIDLLGAEFALVYGPASLQAEYARAEVQPTLGGSGGINGFYVQGSYLLSGENRPYSGGVFGRIVPKNNFSVKNGGWGAWELTTRYSFMDLTDAALPTAMGGKLDDYVVGLNWYLNSNVRIMWNYVHTESDEVTTGNQDADAYMMRIQFDF